jgi:hypothetical protein
MTTIPHNIESTRQLGYRTGYSPTGVVRIIGQSGHYTVFYGRSHENERRGIVDRYVGKRKTLQEVSALLESMTVENMKRNFAWFPQDA